MKVKKHLPSILTLTNLFLGFLAIIYIQNSEYVQACYFLFIASIFLTQPILAEVGFGKPGEPVDLVVGYQPYYTESWSGVVINGKKLWKKHLPSGSKVDFEIGLQGSVIVGKMLGEKNQLTHRFEH